MNKKDIKKTITDLFDSKINAVCEDPYCGVDIEGKEEFIDKVVEFIEYNNGFKYVSEETPPKYVDLLTMDPKGNYHITSWREAHNVFSCQNKFDSSYDWKWRKLYV